MRIRDQVIRSIREFFARARLRLCVDSPMFTPSACEGTTTLFEVEYFGDKAYLTQSGQLYGEASAMALGKIYVFGPTFRAEKSKTRRHLTEFWMVEPEAAFYDLDDVMVLAEDFVARIVGDALELCSDDLDRSSSAIAAQAGARGADAVSPHHLRRSGEAAAGGGRGLRARRGLRRAARDLARQPLRPAGDGPPLARGDQGVLHEARRRRPGAGARRRHDRQRGATARSSVARSARTTWPCSSSGSPSTTCPLTRSAGTPTCGATAPCRTVASAWGWSAPSPGSVVSSTCASASPSPGCSTRSIRRVGADRARARAGAVQPGYMG